MNAAPRRLHAATFAVALLLAAGRAAGDEPAFPWLSREISPAPPRSMHRLSTAGWFVVGVSMERGRAVASSRDGWGITGGLWTSFVNNVEGRSSETALSAAIGGGPGGLAGQLDARFLVGWRGYVTDWQGPFVRVGVESQAFGSFLTFLSAPAGVAGYELIAGRLAIDVGLHGAFAASAGYQVYSGASRDVSDSPVFGPYAWMIAGPAQAGLRWDRLWPHDAALLGHDPIDDLRTSACVAAGPFALVLCANLDIISGPVWVASRPHLFETTGFAQSISVGFGAVRSGAEAPFHAR